VTDFVSNATSLCAFEICPGELFTINFTHCVGPGVGHLSLFSYSDDHSVAQASCGDALYLDNAGYASCRLMVMYQTCQLGEKELDPSCTGQVLLRGETLSTVDITFPTRTTGTVTNVTSALFKGEAISFNISQLTKNEGYLDHIASQTSAHKTSSTSSSSSPATSLVLALYQSDVLSYQTSCHFYSVAQGDLVDYLDKIEWSGRQSSVTMPKYVVSGFTSSYKVVLWAHSHSRGVTRLGESSDILAELSVSVSVDIDRFEPGNPLSGSWRFEDQTSSSQSGDLIALYEVDGNGEYILDSFFHICVTQ
jgi:hypothetical protein